jgi:hypothetical protein
MTRYLDLLTDFVESSDHGVAKIREHAPFGLGVACFLVSGLSLFLAQSLSRHFLLMPVGPIALILIWIWRLGIGILMTGLLHLLSELNGGKGNAVGLFVFLGLSDLVWTLALPVVLMLRLAGVAHNMFVVCMMLTVIGFGSLALRAWGIRENYGLDSARAWALVCVPYILSLTLMMAMVFLAVAGTVVSLLQFFAQ